MRGIARVAFLPALAAFTIASHWPRLRFAGPEAAGEPLLDKMVHLVGFGVLAALAVAAAWPGRAAGPSRWRRAAVVAAAGVGWGFVDEFTQRWVGRQMTLGDLAADGAGAVLGAFWAAWAIPRALALLPAAGPRAAPAAPAGSSAASPPAPARPRPPGLFRSASLVSALTTLSRVTGLARDAVLAGLFGAGLLLDAFFVAFMVPNLFRRLFGEGALTAAFLPRYRRLLDADPDAAGRYASAVIREAAAWLVGAVLIAEAGLLAALALGLGGEKATLGLTLTATMLPYAPLVCGTALLGAIGHARDRFGPAASAPVLLNLGMIAAAAGAALATGDGRTRVAVVAVSVVVLGVLQLLMVRRGVGPVRPQPAPGTPPAGEAASLPLAATRRAMVPMILGLGVFQVNTLLDGLIAFTLSAPADAPDAVFRLLGFEAAYPIRTGGVTTLTLAQRLYQFPLGVFGIAIATVIFPRLAAAAAGPGDAFARVLRRGLLLSLGIGLPATVGLLAVRLPLARAVFERGSFDAADAAAVARILTGYASAVWAYMLIHLWTRAFYAQDDARTPLRVAVVAVVLNLALNLTLVWPLGAAGMAWATAASATGQALVLGWILRRRRLLAALSAERPALGEPSPRRFAAGTATGTLAMGLTLAAIDAASSAETLNATGLLALLVLLVVAGVAVYGTVLLAVLRPARAAV